MSCPVRRVLFVLFAFVAIFSGVIGYVVGPSQAAAFVFPSAGLPNGVEPLVGYTALISAIMALLMRVTDVSAARRR